MEATSNAENYLMSDSEIQNKRIEEIDLAMLARYFRILDRFTGLEDIAAEKRKDGDEESLNVSIRDRLLNYLVCNGKYYVERQIALRMMFESILTAPIYLANVEHILGLQLMNIGDEEQ